MALTKPQGDMVMKLGTEQASTSGTAIDFTGIPAGTRQIVICFKGVSTNGVSALIIQIGDSGGIENTGYLGGQIFINTSTPSAANQTDSFRVAFTAAAATLHGSFILTLEDDSDNTWTMLGGMVQDTTAGGMTAGSKALSGVLDRIRITSVSADTFDAGVINIAYF